MIFNLLSLISKWVEKMINISKQRIFCILILSTILLSSFTVKSEDNKITVEYFYGEHCDTCNETKSLINSMEQYYGDKINLQRYPVEDDPETANYSKMVDYYGFRHYPAVVILNQSSGSFETIPYEEITTDNLILIIDSYLAGDNEETQTDQNNEFNIFLIIVPIVIVLIIVAAIIKKYK